jgi:hypothetical protein
MERKLEKQGEMYVFKLDDKENNFKQEKGYKKEELMEIYKTLKLQLGNVNAAIGDTNRGLKVNIAEDTPELREFMEQYNKMLKLQEKEKLEKQLEQQQKQKEMYEQQIKEIKQAIPEVERQKK